MFNPRPVYVTFVMNWYRDNFSSEYSDFPPAVPFYPCSAPIFQWTITAAMRTCSRNCAVSLNSTQTHAHSTRCHVFARKDNALMFQHIPSPTGSNPRYFLVRQLETTR